MMEIDYNVERTEDNIQIHSDRWVQAGSNKLKVFKMNGEDPVTNLSRVLNINIKKECLKCPIEKNDMVLVTKVAADTARYRSYNLLNNENFCNIPLMQIIGVFKGEISFNNLIPLFDKVIFKKMELPSGMLDTFNSNTMLGKVLKVGGSTFSKDWKKQPSKVKEGDIILVRDNVTTEVYMDGVTYYATEESMVVGIFKEEIKLSKLNLINNSIIMTKYKPKFILNSSILIMPDIDYDMVDEADLDNQNMFEIVLLDRNLTKLKEHDIIFVNKDLTNYIYFGQEKYNIINGMDFVEGKLIS